MNIREPFASASGSLFDCSSIHSLVGSAPSPCDSLSIPTALWIIPLWNVPSKRFVFLLDSPWAPSRSSHHASPSTPRSSSVRPQGLLHRLPRTPISKANRRDVAHNISARQASLFRADLGQGIPMTRHWFVRSGSKFSLGSSKGFLSRRCAPRSE